MPILDVDKARTVMVIKRSMAAGFAGIDNPLYYLDQTLMLFGDAKNVVGTIVRELSGGDGHHYRNRSCHERSFHTPSQIAAIPFPPPRRHTVPGLPHHPPAHSSPPRPPHPPTT